MAVLATRIGSAERTSQVAMARFDTGITVAASSHKRHTAIPILAKPFEPTPIAAYGAWDGSAAKSINALVADVARAATDTLLAQIDAHPAGRVMRFITAIVRLGGKAMMHSVPGRQTGTKRLTAVSTLLLFFRAKLP